MLNLVDNQLTHIRSCKTQAKAQKILCNIHEMMSLSNILFVHHKSFTCKMQKGDDLLNHVNKVKALEDRLICLEVPMKSEKFVMTLLENLPPSYKYLITALDTVSMTESIMEYVTTRLLHEMLKRKER